MLTLTNPIICSEKDTSLPREVDAFFSSLRNIVMPVIESETVEELMRQIIKALPIYIALRESFLESFQDNIQLKASEEFQLSRKGLETISEKMRQKAIAAQKKFIMAFQKVLSKIEETSQGRLSYLLKSGPGNKLLGKMIYLEFIFHCCRESVISGIAIKGGVSEWLIESFFSSSQEFSEDIDSLLNEWDILTDIVGMEAINKSHEARKVTGKPMAGSKTLQEVLNDLER